MLKLPEVFKKFRLCTDASGTGVSGVLLQSHAGRKFLDCEKSYSTAERELLADIWAVQILFTPR